jgi:hypothetical protein
MKNEFSPELQRRLAEADKVNPGIFRVFRSKLPGLYLANAKQIRRERGVCFFPQPKK